jgi:type I restriction enzyme S subunit
MVKPGYKQTEIGALPELWETIPFEECFAILPNNALSRAELNYNGGEVQNIHYGDILIKFPAVLECPVAGLPFINAEKTSKVSRGFLRDGDLIIADTAEDLTVGKSTEVIGIGDKKVVSGLHTIPCRPKDGNMFAPKWLGYFVNHSIYHDQIIPYITGIKVSSISKSAISDTVIAVPPKPEQEAIATALSDVDALIVNLEKLIAKKKAIKQGTMQELLTGKRRLPGFDGEWVDVQIGDLGEVYSGGTPSTSNDEYWGGSIPWMNSGELNLKIVRSVRGRITQKGMDNSSTHMIPAFCVLIGLAGQGKTRGTAAYNTFPLCTNQSIAAI